LGKTVGTIEHILYFGKEEMRHIPANAISGIIEYFSRTMFEDVGAFKADPTPDDTLKYVEGFLEGFYRVEFISSDVECFVKEGTEIANLVTKAWQEIQDHKFLDAIQDLS
jgi:hypothetical protein